MSAAIPSFYDSWCKGDRPDGSSTVLSCVPYTGLYRQHFTHVLRLAAPNTHRGWLEEAVRLPRT